MGKASRNKNKRRRGARKRARKAVDGRPGYEWALEMFLDLQTYLGQLQEEDPSLAVTSFEGGEEANPHLQGEWIADLRSRMGRAKLYSVDPKLPLALDDEAHEHADRLLVDEWGEFAFDAPEVTEAERVMRARRFFTVMRRLNERAVLDVDLLPFDHTYFAYDAGYALDSSEVRIRFPMQAKKVRQVHVLGHLICADGLIVEFFRTLMVQRVAFDRDGLASLERLGLAVPDASEGFGEREQLGFGYGTVLEPGGDWNGTLTTLPQTLTELVAVVHDMHTTYVHTQTLGAGERRKLEPKAPKPEAVPQEYYTVRLRPHHITERMAEKRDAEARKLTYRRDRSKHERCLFDRGPLPLDDRKKASLLKRGYKVYDKRSQRMRGKDMRRAVKRGKLIKGPDEWLAILTTYVQEHQFPNDPTLPYRPANRIVQ